VGFTNIDALDPNETLLEIAKKQNLYQKYFMEYISAEPCSVLEGLSYHILTIGHVVLMNAMITFTRDVNKNNKK